MSEVSDKTVYALIAACTDDLAKQGIAKNQRNTTQGYAFRGIDAVFNALAPILAKHKLVIVPRCLSRECVERQTAKGGVLFNVTVEAEFDFVSAVDGSKHTAKTFGEAMDSGDKATNKAMSAAYKYAAFQTFCIPTEGEDNDADATTHGDIQPTRERISEDQRTVLADAAREHGWKSDEMLKLMKDYRINHSRELTQQQYEPFLAALKAKPKAA